MQKISLKKKIAAAAAAATIVGGAGVALGAWSSSGTGTGSAQSGTSANSNIAGVSPLTANDLYPGAVKEAFVTVTNPNPYPIEVTAISAGSSRLVGSCPVESVRADAATPTSPATALTRSDVSTSVIGPNTGTPLTGTYKLVLRMSNDAVEACKSQAFVLGLGGTPASDMTATIRSAASTSGNGF